MNDSLRKYKKQISHDSWMVKLQELCFGDSTPKFVGYCYWPFFWFTWFCLIALPIALPIRGVVRVVCAIRDALPEGEPMTTKTKTEKKPKLNVRLLRRIQRHILAEPRRLYMEDWKIKSDEAPCGTAACIAGWACVLSGHTRTRHPVSFTRIAIKELGLQESIGYWNDVTGQEEASKLFVTGNWPRDFQDGYNDATKECDKARQAQVTSDRIDWFIEHRE